MEPFIGQIKSFPYGFAPKHWAFCNGQILPIKDNQSLFALIRNKFGGDGQNNFALPDLRGAEPDSSSCHYCIALQGIWPNRN